MSKLCRTSVFVSTIISLLFIGCTKEQKNNVVKISIASIPVNLISKIEIDTIDMITASGFPILKLDTNSTNINFKLEKPKFARLLLNEQSFELYLEPSFDLQITFDSLHKSLLFKGKGSEVNNYIQQSNLIRDTFLLNNNEGFSTYEINEIQEKLKSFKINHKNFYNEYVDSVKASDDMLSLMEKRNTMVYGVLKFNLLWNYCTRNQFQVPDSIAAMLKLPEDSVLLNYGSEQYSMILLFHYYFKYYGLTVNQNKFKTDLQNIKKATPFLVKDSIENDNYPLFLKELYLAKNVLNCIDFIGNSPALDSLWFDFKKNHPNSIWSYQLEKEYNELLAVAPGKPAPDIFGETSNGAEFSLSQLKGNIVYIDVWATWCGPCVAEFPYSKKLQEKFKNNDKVKFLFISIDKNKEKWQQTIKENRGKNAIHIWVDGEGFLNLQKRYKIRGVPQFILIDQKGLVVSAKAESTSSGKIEGEIEKLLRKVE